MPFTNSLCLDPSIYSPSPPTPFILLHDPDAVSSSSHPRSITYIYIFHRTITNRDHQRLPQSTDPDSTGRTSVVAARPFMRKEMRLCKLLISPSRASPLSPYAISPAYEYPRSLTSYATVDQPVTFNTLVPQSEAFASRNPLKQTSYLHLHTKINIYTPPKPADQETFPHHRYHITKACDVGQRDGSSQRQSWRTFSAFVVDALPQHDKVTVYAINPEDPASHNIPLFPTTHGERPGMTAMVLGIGGSPIHLTFYPTITEIGTEWKVDWIRGRITQR